MTSLDNISLERAEASFAVANTPLFLLRRLQSDSAVQDITNSGIGGSTILRALKKAIRLKPRTLHDAVRPYVYLVALSQNRDVSYLEEASRLDAQHFDWFGYIASVLMETYRPTSVETVYVQGQIAAPTIDTRTSIPTNISTISTKR